LHILHEIFPCPGWQNGVGSIQSTHKKPHRIGGIRQDTVLVIEGERPYNPDQDVLRKTEILGTGISLSRRKKTVKPDEEDDSNQENRWQNAREEEAGTGCQRANP